MKTHPAHWLFLAAVIFGALFPERVERGLSMTAHHFAQSMGWFVLMACSLCLILCLYLAFSKYGKLKLGGADTSPQYSTLSWLAMLFAAGMGAGLVFYGAAEPLIHYMTPPPDASTVESDSSPAIQAMVITYFHWGLHAWAIYAMAALTIAYFSFRKNKPLLPSTPITEHTKFAALINSVAILAVVFGIVATLSQGILQLASGLARLGGTATEPMTYQLPILIVLVITYLLSAATGIGKGIKILSHINATIAILLLCFVLFTGPTAYVITNLLATLEEYLLLLPQLSFLLPPMETTNKWTEGWTISYLLWWIAWGPFVGVFIARISKGRTIREFMLGVILIPCLFSALWFSIMGGTALHLELISQPGFGVAAEKPQSVTYALLDTLPLGEITSLVALMLMFVFLITSADSGAYVLGMFTSHNTHNPSIRQRLFWGIMIGLLTMGAILTGGSTSFYRSVAIFGGIPYFFIMLMQAISLSKTIHKERHSIR